MVPVSLPPQPTAPSAIKKSRRFMVCTDRSGTIAKVKGPLAFSGELS
jgi:hypothetical protein